MLGSMPGASGAGGLGIGTTQNINPNVQRMTMGPDTFVEAHTQGGAGIGSPGPHDSRRFVAPHALGATNTPGAHMPSNAQTHVQMHTQPQVQTQASGAIPSAHASTAPVAATLNPATTRMTTLPLAGSGRAIPPLSLREQRALRGWMESDRVYEGAWRGMRERMTREAAEGGRGKLGWWEEAMGGKGRERFGLLWPERKRAERVRKLKKAGVRWEGLRM
jgi:hypothetical protein